MRLLAKFGRNRSGQFYLDLYCQHKCTYLVLLNNGQLESKRTRFDNLYGWQICVMPRFFSFIVANIDDKAVDRVGLAL